MNVVKKTSRLATEAQKGYLIKLTSILNSVEDIPSPLYFDVAKKMISKLSLQYSQVKFWNRGWGDYASSYEEARY